MSHRTMFIRSICNPLAYSVVSATIILALFTGCAPGANPAKSANGAAISLTSAEMFEPMEKLNMDQRTAVFATIGKWDFTQYYNFLASHATDATVTLDGVEHNGILSGIEARKESILAIGETFPTVGDWWSALAINPVPKDLTSLQAQMNGNARNGTALALVEESTDPAPTTPTVAAVADPSSGTGIQLRVEFQDSDPACKSFQSSLRDQYGVEASQIGLAYVREWFSENRGGTWVIDAEAQSKGKVRTNVGVVQSDQHPNVLVLKDSSGKVVPDSQQLLQQCWHVDSPANS